MTDDEKAALKKALNVQRNQRKNGVIIDPHQYTESERDDFALKFAQWMSEKDGTMGITKEDLEQFKQTLK